MAAEQEGAQKTLVIATPFSGLGRVTQHSQLTESQALHIHLSR
jgi:hypothetical protein